MDLNKIKESISEILEVGGTVHFSYKKALNEWYFETSISKYENEYIIHNGKLNGYDKNDAIDKFVKYVFNKKNLAYVITRLEKRVNFNPENYDFERPTQELIDLIEEEQNLIKKENNPTTKIVEELLCEQIKKYKEISVINGLH